MKIRKLIICFTVGVLMALTNCNSNEIQIKKIEGDLYYSFFRLGSFHNLPDSIIQKMKFYADTVNRSQLDSANLEFISKYDVLRNKDLLYSPFIDLKLDNDSIIKVYLTNSEYEKIKIFKRQDLIDTKKKVRIVVDVQNLGHGLALATKIISANKIDGQIPQFDKKLRIEDYQ